MSVYGLITLQAGRTKDIAVTIQGVTTVSSDVIRVKIGQIGATPSLDLSSIAATANGSVVTFTAGASTALVRIAQADTASLTPACYDMEVMVVDDSETAPANAVKHSINYVLVVLGSHSGSVAIS